MSVQVRRRDLAGLNLGINTNGSINQRGVSGTVTLAAGAYGHDRMKAGAGGCTYTFSTLANGDMAFTITAGSIIQALDVSNVFATALWLTWTGTAPARVYQGAVGSAPLLAAGVTASIDGTTVNTIIQSGLALGTVTFVEFGTGTLGTTRPWQIEAALPNAGPTRLGRRQLAQERQLCQAYYWASSYGNPGGSLIGTIIAPAWLNYAIAVSARFPITMRAVPAVTLYNNGIIGQVRNSNVGGAYQLAPNNLGNLNASGFPFMANSSNTGLTQGNFYDFDVVANAEL